MCRKPTGRRRAGWFQCGISGVAITALGGHAVIATDAPGSGSRMVTHPLTVCRFSEIDDFTEREANEIIAKMGHILQTDNDGADPNDVECEVDFILDGPVDTFMEGTGTISTEQDFWEIIKLPGDVKVVESVNWCQNINDAYAGCSDRRTFVVEADWNLAEAGPLWAHEFGHVRDLEHRKNEPNMLMNSPVVERSRQVDDRECRRYR